MRHPHGRHAEIGGEDVVRQRAAEIGQDRRRLAGRPLDGLGGPAHPGMVGIEPGRREIGFRPALDRDHRKAVRVEMAAQGRQEILRVDPDDKADLAGRLGTRRDRIDRVFRVAGREGQHLEAAPAEHLFARAEARLAPLRIDLRRALSAFDDAIRERHAHRIRQMVRHPLAHPDRALLVGDRRQRVRQDDAGIGQQPAPIAGMMAAFAQIHDQVEIHRAARPEKDRRPLRREARPVRGDQHIGAQPVLVFPADLSQSG